MKYKFHILIILVYALVVFMVPLARAADEYNISIGATATGKGLALRGTDTVSLSTDLKLVPGNPKFVHVHDGVTYYFASDETKKLFVADPEKYAPQYGGFCALGIAVGKKLDGSPRYADIVDGKLYLLFNEAVFTTYKKDKAGTIAKANKNWPKIKSLTVAEANG